MPKFSPAFKFFRIILVVTNQLLQEGTSIVTFYHTRLTLTHSGLQPSCDNYIYPVKNFRVTQSTLQKLSIVEGLVVRHGDLSHEMTLSHEGRTLSYKP